MAKKDINAKSILAQNIIARRLILGWTQEHLSEHSGLNLNTIKLIETDKTEGRLTSRRLIAKALGCDADDLYKKPEPSAPDLLPVERFSVESVIPVLERLMNLNPNLRRVVYLFLFEDERYIDGIPAVARRQVLSFLKSSL